MSKHFRVYFGNPFKRKPTNIFFDSLGFGLSFFGGWRFAFIKSWYNVEYNCISAKIVWHTKK